MGFKRRPLYPEAPRKKKCSGRCQQHARLLLRHQAQEHVHNHRVKMQRYMGLLLSVVFKPLLDKCSLPGLY